MMPGGAQNPQQAQQMAAMQNLIQNNAQNQMKLLQQQTNMNMMMP